MSRLVMCCLVLSCASSLFAAEPDAEGFVRLDNGKDFTGWKISENEKSWSFKDGSFVANGDRSHLFYVGAEKTVTVDGVTKTVYEADEKPWKNFELKIDLMTGPKSNGGVYFHSKFQEKGWPKYGFEMQVNNTHGDPKKSGSLYGVVDVLEQHAKDDVWFTEHLIVKGNRVTIKIDGKTVVDYEEPADKKPGNDFTRKLDQGTFALQAHDPISVVRFKNIRVKRLD